MNTSNRTLRIANILALTLTLLVNGLATVGLLNGVATAAISDGFDNKIVPAGFTFSIWGVIYSLLIAFVVYQALPKTRGSANIGPWFVLSCAANIGWLLCWHWRLYGLSMLLMIALLGALIMCYSRSRAATSSGEHWCVQLPFSVYMGWITVATVVNLAVVLIDAGWGGMGLSPAAWSASMIGIACVVAAAVGVANRDWAYLLVLVWAFFGIASRHASIALINTAAWLGFALMAALAMWQIVRGASFSRTLARG